MNELVQMFENQEVKIKTDKGITLINLTHTARCCKLVRTKPNNKIVIRWDDIKKKLKTICSSIETSTPQYIEEINYILDEIENTDDRNSIYMSSWLSKRLAMECSSEKAMKYKNFLATLDEKREELVLFNNTNPQAILQLAQSMQMIGQVVQGMQSTMINMQEFVADSIRSKDLQIDKTAEMIGIRAKQTKYLSEFLKEKLSDLTGRSIMGTSEIYKKNRDKILIKHGVLKWEDIAIGEYNKIHAYIDSLEKEDIKMY